MVLLARELVHNDSMEATALSILNHCLRFLGMKLTGEGSSINATVLLEQHTLNLVISKGNPGWILIPRIIGGKGILGFAKQHHRTPDAQVSDFLCNRNLDEISCGFDGSSEALNFRGVS